jgi:hypothetical protein
MKLKSITPRFTGRPPSDPETVRIASLVEQNGCVFDGTQATVIIALRAHVEVPNELLPDIRVTAGLAFLPDIGWDLELIAKGLPGFLLFSEPSHGLKKGSADTKRKALDYSVPCRARLGLGDRFLSQRPQRHRGCGWQTKQNILWSWSVTTSATLCGSAVKTRAS